MGDQMSDQQIEGYREAFLDMHWPANQRAASSRYWDEISRRERLDWVPLIQRWQWEKEEGIRRNWDKQTWPVMQKEKDKLWERHQRQLRKSQRPKQSVPAPIGARSRAPDSAWNLGGAYPNFGWIVIAVIVILGIFLLLNVR